MSTQDRAPRLVRAACAIFLAAAAAAPLAGCGGGGEAAGQRGAPERSKGRPPWNRGAADGRGPAEAPKIPVVVEPAVTGDMEAFLDASSTLMAEESVDVVSQATGVVVELRVEEGDPVSRGDTLVRLDYQELELAERAARSDLDKLRADYERADKLAKEQLISEEEYQRVRFDYERAEIVWQQRKLDLEHTRITAPISGTVTERLVNVGQLVQENDVVFRIVDFDSLVAPVFVPEKYLANLRPGQRAVVRPRGLDDIAYEGRVLRISPVIDSQSGTMKVTVALDRRAGLRPGMFANVQLVLDTHRGVVIVPKKALVFEDERPHVFVVVGDVVEKRRLEVGYQDSRRVEASSGIDAGETVVVVGQSALKDGSAVSVQGSEAPPVAEAPAGRAAGGAAGAAP